jgi:hypothetical protein
MNAEVPNSDWTFNTLRVFLVQLVMAVEATATNKFANVYQIFEERQRLVQHQFEATSAAMTAAMASSKEAIAKAEFSNEKRFDSVNEFRNALSDQTAKFMPRIEMEKTIGATTDRISRLENRMERLDGKFVGEDKHTTDTNRNYTLLIAIGSGLIAFLSLVVGAIGLFIASYHKV